jgi:hypothetical protein
MRQESLTIVRLGPPTGQASPQVLRRPRRPVGRSTGGADSTNGLLHAAPILCVLLGAVDTDRDMLPDTGGWRSEQSYGTDPRNPDSDRDGFSGGIEVAAGGIDLPGPRLNRRDPDTDDDGIGDFEEFKALLEGGATAA